MIENKSRFQRMLNFTDALGDDLRRRLCESQERIRAMRAEFAAADSNVASTAEKEENDQ